MFYKLDWFAFTFPIPMVGEGDDAYTVIQIVRAFHTHSQGAYLGITKDTPWTWVQSTGFYTHKIQCPQTGLTIAWKGGNNHAHCELSGKTLDIVAVSRSPYDLAISANGRATRIDFAVDIETDISPSVFFLEREEGAFKSTSVIKSESGETCYVGSRSGERMARIYRFASPHPRSRFLRVETEYKGDAAKAACAALTREPLKMVCLASHAPFGWKHECWRPDVAEVSKIVGKREKTPSLSHLRWLLTVAIPSIAKAHHLEELDAYKELETALKKLVDVL